MGERLQFGQIVAGSYEVDHKIGEGTWGEVWAAVDVKTGTSVALKVLAPEATADDEVVERFRREAFFLARVTSERVAQIHDFVRDPELGMVLVLELVEGEPLSHVLADATLPIEEAIELGIDLLAGVHDLHAAHIIHRDLKPANVLMRVESDGRRRPVICDFGLSRLSRDRGDGGATPSFTELTKQDVALGTIKYMSPEQVLNAKQATERTDLYAVGAILYRAVAGGHPFGGEDPRAIAREKVMGEAPALRTGRVDPVARAFEEAVGKALRRLPAERWRDATEMRDALVRARGTIVAKGEDSTTLPGEPTPSRAPVEIRVAAPRRRISSVVLVAAAFALFAVGFASGRTSMLAGEPAKGATTIATTAAPVPQPSTVVEEAVVVAPAEAVVAAPPVEDVARVETDAPVVTVTASPPLDVAPSRVPVAPRRAQVATQDATQDATDDNPY